MADSYALAGSRVIVPVVGEQKYFKPLPFSCAIKGPELLEPFIERGEHGKNITGKVLGAVRGMNQSVVICPAIMGLEKVLNDRVYLVSKRMLRRGVTKYPVQVTFHLPRHLLFVFFRRGHAIKGYLQIAGRVEIGALVAGGRRISQDLGPGGIADRRKCGNQAADRKITVIKGLTMEFPAVNIFIGDASLQSCRVAVRNPVQAQNEPPGESRR